MSSAVQLTITRFSTFSQINEICGGELFATRKNNYSSTMNQILWYWDVHNCRGAKRFLCLPASENTCSDLLLAAGTVRHTLLWHIAVTTAINMKGEEGGRRKLVYSCGEIGLYPPRRWAQHTCVVDLHIWYSSDWNGGNCSWWVCHHRSWSIDHVAGTSKPDALLIVFLGIK